MDYILQQISNIDIGNLIAIGGMFWLFKKHLDGKFAQIEKRFEQVDKRFEQVDKRFEKIEVRMEALEKRMDAIDKRLVAVETTLQVQGGCRLNYNHHELKRVE